PARLPVRLGVIPLRLQDNARLGRTSSGRDMRRIAGKAIPDTRAIGHQDPSSLSLAPKASRPEGRDARSALPAAPTAFTAVPSAIALARFAALIFELARAPQSSAIAARLHMLYKALLGSEGRRAERCSRDCRSDEAETCCCNGPKDKRSHLRLLLVFPPTDVFQCEVYV